MRKIGYARISSVSQKLDRQLIQLEKEKCDVIYEEKASGAATDNRPQLQTMLEGLEKGDVIVVTDLTRISRSSQDLFKLIETIKEKGAILTSLKDSWLDMNADNPYSNFLLTIMGGVNQLERDLLKMRQQEGIAAAKSKGVYIGRKKQYTEKHEGLKHALDLYLSDKGYTVKEVCKITKISEATFYRALKQRRETNQV